MYPPDFMATHYDYDIDKYVQKYVKHMITIDKWKVCVATLLLLHGGVLRNEIVQVIPFLDDYHRT